VALAAWLLALAVLVHVSSPDLAAHLRHSAAAWDTVLYGLEASVLWLYMLATTRSALVAGVATWGLLESAQRSACRLLWPMDRPVRLAEGQFLCDAAGFATSPLSIIAACVLAMLVRWRIGSSA
jgi:hypothetical protein